MRHSAPGFDIYKTKLQMEKKEGPPPPPSIKRSLKPARLMVLAEIRLFNLKRQVSDLAGRPKRTKFWFRNLLGLFSIQPII